MFRLSKHLLCGVTLWWKAANSLSECAVFLHDGERHLGLVHLTCPGENTSWNLSPESSLIPVQKQLNCLLEKAGYVESHHAASWQLSPSRTLTPPTWLSPVSTMALKALVFLHSFLLQVPNSLKSRPCFSALRFFFREKKDKKEEAFF